MTFILLRVFYGLYFLGSALIFYNLVSQLLFRSEPLDDRRMLLQILLILTWPLALLSRSGREQFFKVVGRL